MLEQEGDPAPIQADPEKEYVAVYGARSAIEEMDFEQWSPFFRFQRHRTIRTMMKCPPIMSSMAAFKSTILSGDFQFNPSIDADEDQADSDPEAKLSLQILEECKRANAQLQRPLESWAWEMLDACMERHKLSETVLEPILSGPDAGKYGIDCLKVKPHWTYRYRVDLAMNVKAIDCWTVDDDWKSLNPKHFSWFSWEPHEGDPRGHSLADCIFHAFNMLMQLWPEFYAGNKKFGTPSLFLTTGESQKEMVVPRGPKNEEIPGAKPVTAEYALAHQGSKLLNGGTIAAPYGAMAKVIESTRDGQGMISAIEMLEAQMIVCFLLQTRATREAQHGSKADSESGTGVLVTYAQYRRHEACQFARRPYFEMVASNYDEDIARRHTPGISLGKTDPRTFAAIAQSIGVLYQSGFFTERQVRWICGHMLGIPQSRPGDLRIGPQRDTAAASPEPPSQKTKDQFKAIFAETMAECIAALRAEGMPA